VTQNPALVLPITPTLLPKFIGCFAINDEAVLAPAIKTSALPKLSNIVFNKFPFKIISLFFILVVNITFSSKYFTFFRI
jgi:hypothetical protein